MRSNYKILQDNNEKLIIRDIGPWNRYLTVTNDAENVVDDLVKLGFSFENKRLLYYDSMGILSEILIKDNRFFDFGAVGVI